MAGLLEVSKCFMYRKLLFKYFIPGLNLKKIIAHNALLSSILFFTMTPSFTSKCLGELEMFSHSLRCIDLNKSRINPSVSRVTQQPPTIDKKLYFSMKYFSLAV